MKRTKQKKNSITINAQVKNMRIAFLKQSKSETFQAAYAK